MDVDQDSATGMAPERNEPTWEGLALLPRIEQVLSGRGIPCTAFLRCDAQIKERYGHHLAIQERCAPTLDRFVKNGGELAWHAHLYRLVAGAYTAVRDEHEACDQIEEAIVETRRAGFRFSCGRLGEAWHATACMGAMDRLGIAIDSTALPGRRRADATLWFDWEPTPNAPYHPSGNDYRRPGADPLRILEVPMSTAEIRTAYDTRPLRRYLNPTFHPELFEQGLRNYLDERRTIEPSALVLVFHPGELLERAADGLCAHSWGAFNRNLDVLASVIRQSGAEPAFQRLSEVRT